MDRQIFQLDEGTPDPSLLLIGQNAGGSSEAMRFTVADLKIAMRGYKTYMAAVTYSAGPTFDAIGLENDFSGISFSYDNPSNGTITVTADSSVFTNGATFCVSGAVNDAGTPYFLTGSRFSDTVCNFKILKHDGTGSSTPFFTDVIFEIRVQLD